MTQRQLLEMLTKQSIWRVIRCGCWRRENQDCRSAIRFRNESTDWYCTLGFCVAIIRRKHDSKKTA